MFIRSASVIKACSEESVRQEVIYLTVIMNHIAGLNVSSVIIRACDEVVHASVLFSSESICVMLPVPAWEETSMRNTRINAEK